jgi:hypothetical protein
MFTVFAALLALAAVGIPSVLDGVLAAGCVAAVVYLHLVHPRHAATGVFGRSFLSRAPRAASVFVAAASAGCGLAVLTLLHGGIELEIVAISVAIGGFTAVGMFRALRA